MNTTLVDVFMNAMSMADNYDSRKIDKTEVDGLIISTVFTSDCGYETAIGDANGSFHPVERYDTRELSQEGHNRWCKDIVGRKTITELAYLDYMDAEEVILIRK